jgi:hypothetical protein
MTFLFCPRRIAQSHAAQFGVLSFTSISGDRTIREAEAGDVLAQSQAPSVEDEAAANRQCAQAP